jgi:hypothetical protein
MTIGYYRLTVVGCALSWLMVGLHLPILHEIIDHGRVPHWTVLAIVSLFTVVAVAGLWVLLRAPHRWTTASSSGPSARTTR